MSSSAKRALKHSSIYALGNITRQLAGFIMLPVYTRHLTPADYGVVGMLLAVMALIEVCFGARLAQAVPKFYFDEHEESRKKSVISTALFITGGVSLITMLALIAFRDFSSKILFESSDYSFAVGLFSVLILTQALEYYGMAFIRIQQRPWTFISVSLAKLGVQLGLNIWFVVYLEMGVTGVALGSALSSSLLAFGLSTYTFAQTGLRFCKEQAIRMLRFSWPLWVGALAGLYIGSSNRYFINFFSTTADVGLFELAAKFSTILMLLIWDPFQQYWSTERFRIYKNEGAIETYQMVFQIISALLAIGVMGIGVFSPPVIRLMAAPSFHDASVAVPFLAGAAMFGCLTTFTNFSFIVKEKTLWLTRNNYSTAIILTILFVALVPTWGYVGASIAALIGAAIQFLIVHYAGKRIYNMHLGLRPLAYQTAVATGIVGISFAMPSQSLLLTFLINIGLFALGAIAILVFLLRQPVMRKQFVALLPASIKSRLSQCMSRHA